MGVAVLASTLFPNCVEDVCVAFMEGKLAACGRKEIIIELNVGFGLGIYGILFRDRGVWLGRERVKGFGGEATVCVVYEGINSPVVVGAVGVD